MVVHQQNEQQQQRQLAIGQTQTGTLHHTETSTTTTTKTLLQCCCCCCQSFYPLPTLLLLLSLQQKKSLNKTFRRLSTAAAAAALKALAAPQSQWSKVVAVLSALSHSVSLGCARCRISTSYVSVPRCPTLPQCVGGIKAAALSWLSKTHAQYLIDNCLLVLFCSVRKH